MLIRERAGHYPLLVSARTFSGYHFADRNSAELSASQGSQSFSFGLFMAMKYLHEPEPTIAAMFHVSDHCEPGQLLAPRRFKYGCSDSLA